MDREWLEGTDITDSIAFQEEQLDFKYDLMCEDCPGFGDKFSKQEMLEANLLVISRVFDAIING